ncbi:MULTISPECIES: follicular epithelium yolk protein subunit [Enterobacterales]|uniref:follicular epithelium yolk protein subunit n=1 Tax=Enterobacterales TaxID=91347 RepID=UPI0007967353|nr:MULTISPECIES: follicular epithelium yolk protein subunit [Enterobacterales]MBD8145393.1 follicular epithelium yolk protein subunit [Pantoea agglomerans]MBD8184361.1 follicular epithelium yolk protein subunit [Pantoea agglomerans]MBD8223165.1 follicular epithelium yolk protein subunit [Pantoea agglomerans]WNI43175.1 hypothetical protein RIK66_00255 [Enterobacter ludwigii]WNI52076.1 hypothetical protein RIL74_00575 [Enterobacter ludwigii]
MRINIQLRENIESSIVNGSGVLSGVLTNTEQQTFGLDERHIRWAVCSISGREPNDVFVRSPTPWGDLYQRYNWRQVHRMTEIRSARFLEFETVPEIVAETELVNNSSVSGVFTANMNTTVTNTMSSGWHVDHGITVGQSIRYGVTKVGGETSFEYTHGWGENGEVSESVSLSTGSGVTVQLEPGQAVVALMIASRGQARVQVEYVSYLNGLVATNYNPRHNGHHFLGYGVESVLRALSNSNSRISTETITIGMYSRARVELRDKETKRLLRTVWLDEEIIPGGVVVPQPEL